MDLTNTSRLAVDIDWDIHSSGRVMAIHTLILSDEKVLSHPNGSGELISTIQFVAILNSNPELRESGGWHISHRHPLEAQPTTRWGRLVDHTNSPYGHPALKALGLKE